MSGELQFGVEKGAESETKVSSCINHSVVYSEHTMLWTGASNLYDSFKTFEELIKHLSVLISLNVNLKIKLKRMLRPSSTGCLLGHHAGNSIFP